MWHHHQDNYKRINDKYEGYAWPPHGDKATASKTISANPLREKERWRRVIQLDFIGGVLWGVNNKGLWQALSVSTKGIKD